MSAKSSHWLKKSAIVYSPLADFIFSLSFLFTCFQALIARTRSKQGLDGVSVLKGNNFYTVIMLQYAFTDDVS